MAAGSFSGVVELDGGWVVADASAPIEVRQPNEDVTAHPVVLVGPRSVAVVGPRGWPGPGVDLTFVGDRFWPAHADRMRAASWSPSDRSEIRTSGRLQLRRLSGDVVAEVDVPTHWDGDGDLVEVVWNVGARHPWHPRRVESELWVHAWPVGDPGSEADEASAPDGDNPPQAPGPAPDQGGGGGPAERLAAAFEEGATPLLRTDFSDDVAWAAVVAEVTGLREFDGSPYGPYEPHVRVFDDRAFDGATGASLASMLSRSGRRARVRRTRRRAVHGGGDRG